MADDVASGYLETLARSEPESELDRAVARPACGICFPHFGRGIEQVSSYREAERLLAIYLRAGERLQRDLEGLIQKQDYQRRDEGLDDHESNSWRRAVYHVVGEPPPGTKPRHDQGR